MSRNLLRLSFLITMCTATPLSLPLIHTSLRMSPLTVSVIRAQLHSHRPTVSSAAIMATHKRHTRRHYTSGLFVTRATSRKGVVFDVLENSDTQPTTPKDGNVITSPSVEPRILRPINIKPPVLSRSTSVTATTSISTGTHLVLSGTLPGPSFFPNLVMSQPTPVSHPGLHSAIIPALVGGAIGAALLATLTILVVRRRRLLARGRSERGNKAGFHHWFKSDKKDGVVFIRVPPPSMPLKGILIRNPTIPPTLDDACSDRMSLTSSQMSVMINKLPKSYDSELEDGVLDEVREHGRSSPVKVATRIGPSQSDFLTNLFGLAHTDSFSSGTSSASGESTLPPSLSRLLPHSPPRSQPTAVPYSAYELPPLTLMNSPKPTFPPAVASPSLSHTSGPRGHGLILTGDQSTIAPSFAQWHHQRSMTRDRDGNMGYGPQF